MSGLQATRLRRVRWHHRRVRHVPGTAARGQRARYSLTEAGIQTLPIIYALGNWGLDWRPGSAELRSRQQLMRDEGPAFIEELMDELRARHLGAPPKPNAGPGPLARLDAAHAAAAEREHVDQR
ncbi:hypothetical protein ACIBQ1_15790 [Nonomuraea sp. NPDC050153]|uniref:hypothetical protein n=1 Tax=Nonomuraea sp. NPDC050153 TaxID=3364359 RepID=UPI0037878417